MIPQPAAETKCQQPVNAVLNHYYEPEAFTANPLPHARSFTGFSSSYLSALVADRTLCPPIPRRSQSYHLSSQTWWSSGRRQWIEPLYWHENPSH